jgi:ribosomal protein L7/L12
MMSKVVFHKWRPGLKKISFGDLLREKAGLSLKDAKHCVDDLLEGKAISLLVKNAKQAQDLVDEAAKLGAMGAVVSDSTVVAGRKS